MSLAVDWSLLIHELRFNHGMTMSDIGMATHLNRDSIRTYYNRIARPKHHDGETLILIWINTTHKDRSQLPMEIFVPMKAYS